MFHCYILPDSLFFFCPCSSRYRWRLEEPFHSKTELTVWRSIQWENETQQNGKISHLWILNSWEEQHQNADRAIVGKIWMRAKRSLNKNSCCWNWCHEDSRSTDHIHLPCLHKFIYQPYFSHSQTIEMWRRLVKWRFGDRKILAQCWNWTQSEGRFTWFYSHVSYPFFFTSKSTSTLIYFFCFRCIQMDFLDLV